MYVPRNSTHIRPCRIPGALIVIAWPDRLLRSIDSGFCMVLSFGLVIFLLLTGATCAVCCGTVDYYVTIGRIFDVIFWQFFLAFVTAPFAVQCRMSDLRAQWGILYDLVTIWSIGFHHVLQNKPDCFTLTFGPIRLLLFHEANTDWTIL